MITAAKPWTEISDDQQAVLYPTFARHDTVDDTWRIWVRGFTHWPSRDNFRRRLFQAVLRQFTGADASQMASDLFRRRVDAFTAITRGGQRIVVNVGSQAHVLDRVTRRNGHFSGQVNLPAAELSELSEDGHFRGGWLRLSLATAEDETRQFSGTSRLLEANGVSVISDIDDTIKRTDVSERRSLLRNTFLNEFQSVPGMASAYRRWAAEGAAFHYVSSSPWQLYHPLAELLHRDGFPRGTFHLRSMRLRDPSVLKLFVARRLDKRRAISRLLSSFPDRRFVLVGDSTEKDPEIYGWYARHNPGQVAQILIRRVPHTPHLTERLKKAFRGLPTHCWQLFDDAAEIDGSLAELAAV